MLSDTSFARTGNVMEAAIQFGARLRLLKFTPSDYGQTSIDAHTGIRNMQTFSFQIILAEETELTHEMSERIYEAGGDDSSPSSSNGIVTISFDRESHSLDQAIRSAIAVITAAGYRALKVELEAKAFA